MVLRSIAPVFPGSLTSELLLESELADPLADDGSDFGTAVDTVRLTWLSVSFLARVECSVEPWLCDVDTLAEPEFESAEPEFGSAEPDADALPESVLAEPVFVSVEEVTELSVLVTEPTSELTGSDDAESDGAPIVA